LTYANGVFYGTTTYGGGSGCSDEQGCGTVFSLTPQGTENVLYRFTGSTDGEYPSSLIFVGGALYGTTSSGGANGYGTVFKVVP
jgi:uncharacterized repeat protein (TIGR03803 family)